MERRSSIAQTIALAHRLYNNINRTTVNSKCVQHEVLEQVYCEYFPPKTLADSTESSTEQMHIGWRKGFYMDLWSVSDRHTNKII